jgi:hypothetical protein
MLKFKWICFLKWRHRSHAREGGAKFFSNKFLRRKMGPALACWVTVP